MICPTRSRNRPSSSYQPCSWPADAAAPGGTVGTTCGVVTVGTALGLLGTAAPECRLAPAQAGGPEPAGARLGPAPWAVELEALAALDAPAELDVLAEPDFRPEPVPAHAGGPWPGCVSVTPAPRPAELDPCPEGDPAHGGGPCRGWLLAVPK